MAVTQNSSAAPFWLVPSPIRKEQNLALLSEWFKEEARYCYSKLSISAFFASLVLGSLIYFDTHYDPPADFRYSLLGRGSLALYFFSLAIFLRYFNRKLGEVQFLWGKLLFGLGTFLAFTYQFQYSEDYANRARYIPVVLFVLGVFALRIGPSFTAVGAFCYLAVMIFFNVKHPGHFVEDINHFIPGMAFAFFFQNRIYYESIHFLSEWKERRQLEEAESEARILASHAYGELTKLVYPHVVNMIQGGKKIENTMPAGVADAAVICFDTVDSSKISDPDFPGAMEEFQGRLYSLMCEFYDPSSLEGSGYRVKDVGDGVYYSVGFPFKLPGAENACDLAVRLSFQAISLFHDTMAKLNYNAPINCGVGVAFGQVEGFFPKLGLQQYDVRGRAMVLANRYQAFRYKLRELGLTVPGDSTLVISAQTYTRLSEGMKARFQKMVVDKKDLQVRNDHSAGVLFWAKVSYAMTENSTRRKVA